MKTITLNIPEEIDEKEVTMVVASQLYQQGKLSSGQAADLVGITKREFVESLGKYGVSVFSDSVEDLEHDVLSLNKFLHDNNS
ncbi:UPF0175 family protein [Marinoscillum sp.]|uniref:UPF0175 family protein n=1 Tax=Marinoscillum sp. TaxID=2024838 RepID=UPI003BA99ADA